MKKKNDHSLGEAIDQFIRKQQLSDEVHEARMKSYWPELMGPAVVRQTAQLWFKDGKLYVRLSHPILRQELQYSKDKIKEEMNKVLLQAVIKEVILC